MVLHGCATFLVCDRMGAVVVWWVSGRLGGIVGSIVS